MTRTLRGLDIVSQARLRTEAIALKEAGFDFAAIGRQLDVTTIAARDLCMQYRRLAQRRSKAAGFPALPRSVVDLLVNGQYAALVSRAAPPRMRYLAEIASFYARNELLREPGIGRITLERIERWLAAYGYRLRLPDESVAEVICRFRHDKVPGGRQGLALPETTDVPIGVVPEALRLTVIDQWQGAVRH